MFVVSLVSIIASTATSALLSPSTIMGRNLPARLAVFRGRSLFADRLSVLLITLASLATAFPGRTILELLELSASIGLVALFVPLVFGLYGRPRGELAALLAMAFGTLVRVAREAMEFIVVAPCETASDEAMTLVERLVAEHTGSASAVGWLVYVFRASAVGDIG